MTESKRDAVQTAETEPTVQIGRYVLHREIARGGMATIHIARLLGDEGFSRIVAVKRLHPEFAEDEEFVSMFLDEARVASRVQHHNVVPVLDVAAVGQEVILVQEYVHGVPLDALLRSMRQKKSRLPPSLAVAIACQLLAGLHATHETVDELGEPMHIVHRDVSPQNVMMSVDGSARLLDFGIAKSHLGAHVTQEGTYKGKLAYSAPEQLLRAATPQSDIYSLSVLLWELLVGQRMHRSKSNPELVSMVMSGALPSIREALTAAAVWDTLDGAERNKLQKLAPIVQKGLCVETSERWATARDMEEALATAVRPAPARVLAEWVRSVGKTFLERRAAILVAEEEGWRRLHPRESVRAWLPDAENSAVDLRISSPRQSTIRPAFVPGRVRARWKVGVAIGGAVVVASALALLLPPASHGRPADGPGAGADSRASAPLQASPNPTPEPHTEMKTETSALPPLAPPTRVMSVPPLRPPTSVLAPPVRPLLNQARANGLPAAPLQRGAAPVVLRPVAKPISPAPAASAPAAAERANDCDVPYYFEGKKKIFKLACI